MSDDEDEGAENGTTKTSWRATPKQRQQQQRSSPSPPSSPDDRGAPPRQGLAGLVASSKTTTPTKTAKTTTPPPVSFSEAINKAKAAEAALGEKAPNSKESPSPPKTQSPVQPVASRLGTATSTGDEDEDEDEDMTLRIPGSFDLPDYDDGGDAGGTDVINVLGDLWRRMQLRR